MKAESVSPPASALIAWKVHQQRTSASAGFGYHSPREEEGVNFYLYLQKKNQ